MKIHIWDSTQFATDCVSLVTISAWLRTLYLSSVTLQLYLCLHWRDFRENSYCGHCTFTANPVSVGVMNNCGNFTWQSTCLFWLYLSFHWNNILEDWNQGRYAYSPEAIPVWLRSVNNGGHVTWRTMCLANISASVGGIFILGFPAWVKSG